jgi:hypothetical protein
VAQVTDADNDEFEPGAEDELEAATDREPDVLLDVSELSVDEITLEVEDLHARVSLEADVLDLLRLHVGVDAQLARVKLTIKDVEAQALLKVRLDNVARLIERVMDTIDNNPDLVERLLERLGAAVETVGAGAGEAVGALGTAAGQAVEDVGGAVGDVGRAAGQAVEDVGEGVGPAVRGVARPKRPTEGEPEVRRRRRKAESAGTRPAKRPRSSGGGRSEER